MAMSKKDFIALADTIRTTNAGAVAMNMAEPYTEIVIAGLADFCRTQNSAFNRARWIGYIKGENGSSGGKVAR